MIKSNRDASHVRCDYFSCIVSEVFEKGKTNIIFDGTVEDMPLPGSIS
jgi:hypothetical protein